MTSPAQIFPVSWRLDALIFFLFDSPGCATEKNETSTFPCSVFFWHTAVRCFFFYVCVVWFKCLTIVRVSYCNLVATLVLEARHLPREFSHKVVFVTCPCPCLGPFRLRKLAQSLRRKFSLILVCSMIPGNSPHKKVPVTCAFRLRGATGFLGSFCTNILSDRFQYKQAFS